MLGIFCKPQCVQQCQDMEDGCDPIREFYDSDCPPVRTNDDLPLAFSRYRDGLSIGKIAPDIEPDPVQGRPAEKAAKAAERPYHIQPPRAPSLLEESNKTASTAATAPAEGGAADRKAAAVADAKAAAGDAGKQQLQI
eukprot:TRINITY_DN104041_c0_g1_i1.p2 TRINITY_DN104041_c0_g1~~TRINITY_DN104041_c0_g1_i1.p2  ORF type:complete len:138 (-),score=36.48 TRINITY_DN104041_c0_g1_i1:238-651(-)